MSYYKNRLSCSNCGREGHIHKECEAPIMSYGIILFYVDPITSIIYYNIVQRKHSIPYIDFVRGKYNIDDFAQIQQLFSGMTREEKNNLLTQDFDTIWANLWSSSTQRIYEKNNSRNLFNKIKQKYNITTFTNNPNIRDSELEWGFPKGRRNKNESDIDCARRECSEETYYKYSDFKCIRDIEPFEEEFLGTNRIFYKYIYFICNFTSTLTSTPYSSQNNEISDMKWVTFEQAIKYIGKSNRRRISLLRKVHKEVTRYLNSKNN